MQWRRFLLTSSTFPAEERVELQRAIVERVSMSDDLTDDDFAELAAASFRALDDEEDVCAGARGSLAGGLWDHTEGAT